MLEKGSEVGAHILSGAVIDPIALNELIPDWKEKGAPLDTPVTDDRFYFLGHAGSIRIPNFGMPPLMSNHGNYIVSLGNVCRWLAEQAEALGVEIYPGFPAAEIAYGDKGEVLGVITGDMGVARDGHHKDSYTPGMMLLGKYTLIAEGARGSLTKGLRAKFDLEKDSDYEKFGIGLKELWELEPGKHKPGLVMHTMGWPLDNRTGGGLFMYHFGENLVRHRLCGASELFEPVYLALRRVPAGQASSRDPATIWTAASAFPMARAPSPRAGSNRCRSSTSRAGR